MVETDAHTQLLSECVGVYCAVEPRKKPALASVADILGLLDRHKVEFIKNENPPPSAELEFKSDPPSEEPCLFGVLIIHTYCKCKSLGFAGLLSAGVSFSLDPLISVLTVAGACIKINLLHTCIWDTSLSDLIWLCFESCCDWSFHIPVPPGSCKSEWMD